MKTESGDQIAVVANQIIQSRHKLDPRQQKVIAWAIGQIARDDTDFMSHTLSVAEFAKLTGAENSGQIYRQMETVTTSLLRTILEVREREGDRIRTKFQWLSRCEYHDGEGTVEIKFHELLKPYLLELRTRFTQLRLDRFFKFRSSYTIRFFERIEMQRGLGRESWQTTLSDLRDWLGIEPAAYAFFGLFRAKILEVAQRELDLKSDWSFSFVTIKTGRKITGIEFTLRPARSPKSDPARDRWKKASPEIRTKILAAAKCRSRWEGLDDQAILADSAFWNYLGDLVVEVEEGQKALAL